MAYYDKHTGPYQNETSQRVTYWQSNATSTTSYFCWQQYNARHGCSIIWNSRGMYVLVPERQSCCLADPESRPLSPEWLQNASFVGVGWTFHCGVVRKWLLSGWEYWDRLADGAPCKLGRANGTSTALTTTAARAPFPGLHINETLYFEPPAIAKYPWGPKPSDFTLPDDCHQRCTAVPAPPPPGTDHKVNITLDQQPYHVILDGNPAATCIHTRDVHRVTGTITPAASTLSVHDDNGTITDDYALKITPGSIKMGERALTTSYVCNGTSVTLHGRLYINSQQVALELIFGTDHLTAFVIGVNPPPPPPKCSGGESPPMNKSACDAVPPAKGGTSPACAWCVSDDKLHNICFVRDHQPTTGWHCDR